MRFGCGGTDRFKSESGYANWFWAVFPLQFFRNWLHYSQWLPANLSGRRMQGKMSPTSTMNLHRFAVLAQAIENALALRLKATYAVNTAAISRSMLMLRRGAVLCGSQRSVWKLKWHVREVACPSVTSTIRTLGCISQTIWSRSAICISRESSYGWFPLFACLCSGRSKNRLGWLHPIAYLALDGSLPDHSRG